jgi:hypothetical protein
VISEIIPVMSRRPIFGYKTLIFATVAIAGLSMAVWAHHLYVTGQILLPFFAIMTMLIAVPTGVKFFNWIGTMWGGSLTFHTPLIWALGFLTTFLFGGITGVMMASPAIDFHISDTYFIVAHFHYTVFGTVVFAMFAGYYFWWPKLTGRMLDERLGKIHFWMLFIGFHRRSSCSTCSESRAWSALRRLPRRGRLPDRQHHLDHRLRAAGRIDAALPLQRLEDVAHGSAGDRGRPVGLWELLSGRPRARRRGTTSTACPGSARSVRPRPASPAGCTAVRTGS